VKKVLVGCLVILMLGVVVFVAGSYLLYRAASPMIQNAREYVNNLNQLDEIDRQIANKAAYTAPASNELTEAQVERFVRVQEQVRAALGQRFDELEKKYDYLKQNQNQQGREPTIAEAFTALGEMFNVLVQARRLQVDALNKEGFSREEYSWVRERVFQAAGFEVANQIDFRKLQEAIKSNTGLENIETPDVPKVDVPEKNRALVKPHVEKLGEWLPLVFFGL
jgi:hypothetical protein